MPDIIEVEILDDGIISIKTEGISGTNHVSADGLLNEIEEAAGGVRTSTKRKDKKRHMHVHKKVHA